MMAYQTIQILNSQLLHYGYQDAMEYQLTLHFQEFY